jgi:hypothetical protein
LNGFLSEDAFVGIYLQELAKILEYATACRGLAAGVRIVPSLSHGLEIAVPGDLLIIGKPGVHQVSREKKQRQCNAPHCVSQYWGSTSRILPFIEPPRNHTE